MSFQTLLCKSPAQTLEHPQLFVPEPSHKLKYIHSLIIHPSPTGLDRSLVCLAARMTQSQCDVVRAHHKHTSCGGMGFDFLREYNDAIMWHNQMNIGDMGVEKHRLCCNIHGMYRYVGYWSYERYVSVESEHFLCDRHCHSRYLRSEKSCEWCFINNHRILCFNTSCPRNPLFSDTIWMTW